MYYEETARKKINTNQTLFPANETRNSVEYTRSMEVYMMY